MSNHETLIMMTAAISDKGHKKPPPLWFVTNGAVTVGPVTTNLLVRGVLHERVPRDCLVRERTWRMWRHIERIREVAALRKSQDLYGNVVIDKTRWSPARESHDAAFRKLTSDLFRARDPGEVLLFVLAESMKETGACVGAIHRRRPPWVGLVTSSVMGPGMSRRLGRVIGGDDPVLEHGTAGGWLCESPRDGGLSGRVRDRLGDLPACSGIAMIPVHCSGRLYAMIELGRPDHGFREGDVARVRSIAGLAADRLGIVRNWHQV
jgi:hypothetical protein